MARAQHEVSRLPQSPTHLALAKLASSGLSKDHMKRLKMKALSAKETRELGHGFHAAPSLLLPYFDAKGRQTKFFRVRYLDSTGFEKDKEKVQKYMQPSGTCIEAYLPPLLPRPWERLLADPTTPLYITEGELKAACATSRGFPAIGLGGVDSWRAAKRGISFLPVLEKARWEGRKVVIAYDSDAATNPNVVRAQLQLAQELTQRGALPTILSLPEGANHAKQGLDDYLVAVTDQEFQKRVDEAPPFLEAAALWRMNEEVVYVRDPGLIVVRATGQRLSPANFTQHTFSNRHYVAVELSKNGPVRKEKPLAKRWLEWEGRFELERITYAPGKPAIHNNEWNVWPGWGVSPQKGDVTLWKDLLDYIFKEESKGIRKWFEQWCAYPLQNPGTKLYTAAVIWGRIHGTGKTLVAYTLMAIYGKNAVEIKSSDLRGNFNSWAQERQFVYGDEITGTDSRFDSDRLKGLITQKTIRVNAKYVPEFVIPDCINYLFSSNHPDAFFVEDTDRRYLINEVVGSPLGLEFYNRYDKWLHGEGPAALFHHLLHLDLTGFDPRSPAPQTEAKVAMIRDTKSDASLWASSLKEDPTSVLGILGPPEVAQRCALLTSQQLLKLYDPAGQNRITVNGLSRELKRSGFRQATKGHQLRLSTGQHRLFCIRDPEVWLRASPKACIDHWERFFGNGQKEEKY